MAIHAPVFTRATPLQGATALLLLSALLGPLVVAAVVMLWYAVPELRVRIVTVFPFLQSGWVRMTGSLGGVSLPALLPYAIAVVQELLFQLGLSSDRDPMEEGAAQGLREAFGQGARVAVVRRHGPHPLGDGPAARRNAAASAVHQYRHLDRAVAGRSTGSHRQVRQQRGAVHAPGRRVRV